MIPLPKPKFFERKVPDGQTEEYFDEIIYRQSHVLRNAIDRVSNIIRTEDIFIRTSKRPLHMRTIVTFAPKMTI